MKSIYQVVQTDTSLVIMSKSTFLTSIPLRRWETADGSRWSGCQRLPAEIEWLQSRLAAALQVDGPDSVMRRVSQVLTAENQLRQGRVIASNRLESPETPNIPVARRLPPSNTGPNYRPRQFVPTRTDSHREMRIISG